MGGGIMGDPNFSRNCKQHTGLRRSAGNNALSLKPMNLKLWNFGYILPQILQFTKNITRENLLLNFYPFRLISVQTNWQLQRGNYSTAYVLIRFEN